MSGTTGPRKKSWHESKQLRKRAAFLLEDPSLIPTDVCFRIRTGSGKIKELRGHKIFFALASPMFHAEFYGSVKEQGNVEITDVSVEAFLGLQRYIYTDSFDGVSVTNMIDILAASKKYLMAKLTRYCYGFIQNHITPENSVSLWSQAQEAFDDIVVEQCVAEIRRNTTKAVSLEGFLNITQDQLFELTSWQNLTIHEFDLFQAVKNWKFHPQNAIGSSVSCSRKDGGIFQNIRFTLFTPEQLADDDFVLNEVFCADEVKEMFRHKTAGRELRTFSPRARDPSIASFQLSIKYFVSNKFDRPDDMGWRLFGAATVVIWADVAPRACQILRQYVENGFFFRVGQTVGRLTDENAGVLAYGRMNHNPRRLSRAEVEAGKQIDAGNKIDAGNQSGLWYAPDSVLLTLTILGPRLVICSRMGSMGQTLLGQQPNNTLTKCTASKQPGIVVGKVISSPPKSLRQLQDFTYAASLTSSQTGRFLLFPRAFECSLIEPQL